MKDISLTGAVAPIDASRTRENANAASAVPLPVRIALMREHGRGSYAFSAVYQSGLEHFGDERGFLAYKKVGRTALVLSDPVAPPENLSDLISRFVAHQRDAGFWFVSHGVAKVLAEQGFTINAMGYDTHIDLPTYSFSGRKKQTLREALNRMVKRGFVTREGSLTEVGIPGPLPARSWSSSTGRCSWRRNPTYADSSPSIRMESWWRLPSSTRFTMAARSSAI
jgi:hypothetical protein